MSSFFGLCCHEALAQFVPAVVVVAQMVWACDRQGIRRPAEWRDVDGWREAAELLLEATEEELRDDDD